MKGSTKTRLLLVWLVPKWTAIAALLVVVALVPELFPTFFASSIGVQTLVLGIAAASLVFLNAVVGMVSLAQTALYGIAAYTAAKLAVEQGVDPWLSGLIGLAITTAIGLTFGAIVSRSEGIYFLMITLAFAVITYYFFSQVTAFGSHEGINNVQPPSLLGNPFVNPTGMYYAGLACSVLVFLLIRNIRRTPFGYALQGVRDQPERSRALGFSVPLLRTLGFAVGAFIAGIGGVLSAWYNGNISPGSIDLIRTIDLLVIAVVGGLGRLEGAWIGALLFTLLDTYSPAFTARFETAIGLAFLAVVFISPGGLAGVLAGLDRRIRHRLE